LLQDIADYKKSENEKSITLNEQQLKKQREADEKKTSERDKLRRQALEALGLGPIKKTKARTKDDLDFLKVEAGQILIDYMNLDTKLTRINQRF
jgi:carboxyl-terminal processing protease